VAPRGPQSRLTGAAGGHYGMGGPEMLNRKFADLRHAPELDPRLLDYDPSRLPQAVVAMGPGARPKTKGGVLIAAPEFTWALSFFPGRWYAIVSAYDAQAALVAHHVDLCVPPEERDGILSFLDLKLDLLVHPDGRWSWLDQDDYDQEVAAGTIPPSWQEAVAATVAALDRQCRDRVFPPPPVARYRPGGPGAGRAGRDHPAMLPADQER
jgi:predicted RNA-binding protein associated with RNAse of E/G family